MFTREEWYNVRLAVARGQRAKSRFGGVLYFAFLCGFSHFLTIIGLDCGILCVMLLPFCGSGLPTSIRTPISDSSDKIQENGTIWRTEMPIDKLIGSSSYSSLIPYRLKDLQLDRGLNARQGWQQQHAKCSFLSRSIIAIITCDPSSFL